MTLPTENMISFDYKRNAERGRYGYRYLNYRWLLCDSKGAVWGNFSFTTQEVSKPLVGGNLLGISTIRFPYLLGLGFISSCSVIILNLTGRRLKKGAVNLSGIRFTFENDKNTY